MNSDELRQLIQKPAYRTLEYTARIPSPGTMAKILAAFANSQGGTLVIGLKRPGEVVGMDEPRLATQLLDRALKMITPPISAHAEMVDLDGKTLFVAQVKMGVSTAPHLASGQIFYRNERRIVPMPADVLYDLVQRRVSSVGDLWAELKLLTAILARQNQQVVSVMTWRDRLGKMALGGMISAFILRPVVTPTPPAGDLGPGADPSRRSLPERPSSDPRT